MALELPTELSARYRDERHVARVPFLLNGLVDDEDAFAQLRQNPIAQKDVFVGIAGLRALDILVNAGAEAGSRYKQAVLLDSNLTQIKAMHGIFKLIEESPTPDAFIEKFVPHYVNWVDHIPRTGHDQQSAEDRQYFAARGSQHLKRNAQEAEDYLSDQLYNEQSWLFSENYRRIRKMVMQGDIGTAVVHLSDPERMGKLAQSLKSKDLRVSDLYLSSVLASMYPGRVFDYYNLRQPEGANPIAPLTELLDDQSRILVSMPQRQGKYNFKLDFYNTSQIQQLKNNYEEASRHLSPQQKDYAYFFSAGDRTLLLDSEVIEGQRYFFVFIESNAATKHEIQALNRAVEALGVKVCPHIQPPKIQGQPNLPHSVAFTIPESQLGNKQFFDTIRDMVGRELAPLYATARSL